jgi:hypothetical protein
MIREQIRMICRACGLYLLFFCVTASSATAQFKARLLTKGEIDAAQISADPVRMPGIAGPVRINEAQAFSIEGSGFAKLLMVPVRYAWHDKEPARPTNSDMCGVFLIRSESVRQFIQTVGMGWLDVFNCNSLEAVGFLAGEAGGLRELSYFTPRTALTISKMSQWYWIGTQPRRDMFGMRMFHSSWLRPGM